MAGRARGRWQVGKGDAFWALVMRGECVGRARGAKGVSWAERRVTGPRGVSRPSGERELGPRGNQLGQGRGLGFQGRWDWAAGLV